MINTLQTSIATCAPRPRPYTWATPYALSIMGKRQDSNCPFGNGNGYGDGRAISVGEAGGLTMSLCVPVHSFSMDPGVAVASTPLHTFIWFNFLTRTFGYGHVYQMRHMGYSPQMYLVDTTGGPAERWW